MRLVSLVVLNIKLQNAVSSQTYFVTSNDIVACIAVAM
jgi:hypothetical protein